MRAMRARSTSWFPPCVLPLCAALLGAAPLGCGGSSASELDRVVEALGGRDALRSATNQRAVATGTRYDQHESCAPFPGESDETTVQMEFTSTVAVAFEGQAQSSSWDGTTFEVFPGTHPVWTETSQGNFGYTTGTPSGFPPTVPASMNSVQVAARWKQQALASPAMLLRFALDHPDAATSESDREWKGNRYRVIAIDGPWGWPESVRLFIDPDTHLPAKSETVASSFRCPISLSRSVQQPTGEFLEARLPLPAVDEVFEI